MSAEDGMPQLSYPNTRRLAGAPVSFGVWGPHRGPIDGSSTQVLAALARIGYGGSELGPFGYLGDPKATGQQMKNARLRPAGIYVGLRLAAADIADAGLDELEMAAASLSDAVRIADVAGLSGPPPILVIADDGAHNLQNAPRDPSDRESGLSKEGWEGARRVLAAASMIATRYDLTAAVHPHLATWIESEWEIDRLLDTTDLALVLDTGHLLLAGINPSMAVRKWRARITHVHLKDVAVSVAEEARSEGPVPLQLWWDRACVRFGHGDVDLGDIVTVLERTDYDGWYVNERDVAPTGVPELIAMVADQQHDFHKLREYLMRSFRANHPGVSGDVFL